MKSLYIMLGLVVCTQSFAIERYMIDMDGGGSAVPPQKKLHTEDMPQIKAVDDMNNSYRNTAAIPQRANTDNLINDETKILAGTSLLEVAKEVEKKVNEIEPSKNITHMNFTNISNGVGIATSVYDSYESVDNCITSSDKTTSTQGCAKIAYDGYQVVKNTVDTVAEYKDAFKQASKSNVFSSNAIVNTIEGANSLVQGGIAAYDPIVKGEDYTLAAKQFIEHGTPFQTGLGIAGGSLGAIPGAGVVLGVVGATVGELTGQVLDESAKWAISSYEMAELQDELIKDKEASLRRKMVKQAAFEMKSIELQREQDKMRSEAQKQHDDMIFMQQVVMPAITSPAGGTAVTAPAGDWETSKGRNQGGTEHACRRYGYACNR